MVLLRRCVLVFFLKHHFQFVPLRFNKPKTTKPTQYSLGIPTQLWPGEHQGLKGFLRGKRSREGVGFALSSTRSATPCPRSPTADAALGRVWGWWGQGLTAKGSCLHLCLPSWAAPASPSPCPVCWNQQRGEPGISTGPVCWAWAAQARGWKPVVVSSQTGGLTPTLTPMGTDPKCAFSHFTKLLGSSRPGTASCSGLSPRSTAGSLGCGAGAPSGSTEFLPQRLW